MAREEDYTISGQITEAAFDKLYKAGKMEELRDLIQNSKDIDTEGNTTMVSTRNANNIIG